jgi:hypothetical protein
MMTEIFLPRDKLLTSAGLLPVYYWFIRSIDTKYYSVLRNFLVDVESQRNENKKTSKDPELTVFEQYNRSTNDEKSHLERVRILKVKFEAWVKLIRKDKP